MSDSVSIEKRIRELGLWYHNFELAGVMTNPAQGEYPSVRWRMIAPFVPDDLTGKSVLDVGCNAGFFSLQLKARGARRVLGIDAFAGAIDQARFAAEVRGLDVEYRVENVYDFALTNQEPFDYVVFLGLFYHLRHPLLVLDKLAATTRERMYFQTVIRGGGLGSEPADEYPLEEVAVFDEPTYPRMAFVERRFADNPTNWWLVNEPCAWAVLRSAGLCNITKVGDDTFVCDAPLEVHGDRNVSGNEMGRVPTFERVADF